MAPDEIAEQLRAAGCVYAEEEARLLLAAPGDVASMVARRLAGEPLEVILGWADFGGLRIEIDPGVFVPRQRSLALVEVAVSAGPRRLLDLGCGCGALAAAVRRQLPALQVWAVDVDPAAVACAARNLGEAAHVVCGSWFDPLPDEVVGTFDVIVANVPYVPRGELGLLPVEAREHEPIWALDGGLDGLDHQRVVIAQASRWLASGGLVVVEVGATQAEAAVGLMEAAGLRGAVRRDTARGATVVTGRLPGSVYGDRPR